MGPWFAGSTMVQPAVGLVFTAGFEGAVVNGPPVGGRFDANLFGGGWDLGGGMAFGLGGAPGDFVVTQAEDWHLGRRFAVGADDAVTVWAGVTRFQWLDDVVHGTSVGPIVGGHVDLAHLRRWEELVDGEVVRLGLAVRLLPAAGPSGRLVVVPQPAVSLSVGALAGLVE